MAYTPTRFWGGTVPTTQTTEYTVPTAKTAIVKEVLLCNTSASNVTVSVALSGYYVTNGLSISANQTVTIDMVQVLNAGEVIQLNASVTGVVCMISGVVIG